MKKILVLSLALLLAACQSIVKVEGEQVLAGKLSVRLSEAWNKVPLVRSEPWEVWTQEGMPLDQLRFWSGIAAGKPLMTALPASSGIKDARVPTFTAGMSDEQLVRLFEIVYSADGSLVTVGKVEPAAFAGARGLRFEFTVTRKSDDLHMQGVGWFAVHKGELFAATYLAPRLSFFPRLLPKAEAVVRTAAIKG